MAFKLYPIFCALCLFVFFSCSGTQNAKDTIIDEEENALGHSMNDAGYEGDHQPITSIADKKNMESDKKEKPTSNDSILNKAVDKIDADKGARGEPLLAFVRDGTLWISEIDGTKSRQVDTIPSGTISPDGKKIVFISHVPIEDTVRRDITVLNISSGEKRTLQQIGEEKISSPCWSPDSSKVLVNLYQNKSWIMSSVSLDGTGINNLEHNCFSPTWTVRGIYCHTIRNLILISEDDLTNKWTWKNILGSLWDRVSVPMRISPSKDGARLLFVLPTEESDIKRISGAVFLYDFVASKLEKISPAGYSVHSADWLPGEDGIIFSAVKLSNINRKRLVKGKKVRYNIYKINRDGDGFGLVIENAKQPSVSNGR